MSFYLEKDLKFALEVGVRWTAVYGEIVKWWKEDVKLYTQWTGCVWLTTHAMNWGGRREACVCVCRVFLHTWVLWVQSSAITWSF